MSDTGAYRKVLFSFYGLLLVLAAIHLAIPAQAACLHTVNVANVVALYNAVTNAQPGDCIKLADGTYQLNENSPLRFNNANNVVLTSASNDPTKVIIRGIGFIDDGSMPCSTHPGEGNNDCLWVADFATCTSLTISAITFTEACYGIKVNSYSSPQDIEILNCRFINFGFRCIKGTADTSGNTHALYGLVQNCYFEDNKLPNTCWIFNGDYIAGIDMMRLDSWTFQDNTFLNIKGADGGGRSAFQLWVGCKNCILQRNKILNCDRGVSLGLYGCGEISGQNMTVMNNYISNPVDCCIEMGWVDGCKIYNNSCYRPDDGARGIRCIAYNTITNTNIENNLIDGQLDTSGLTSGVVSNNYLGTPANYWVNPAANNLDLTAQAVGAIAQGVSLPEVTQDIYLHPRQNPPCIGADEIIVTPTPNPTPCSTFDTIADYNGGTDPTSSGGITAILPSGYDSTSNTTTTGTATYDGANNHGGAGYSMNLTWNMQPNGWVSFFNSLGTLTNWTNYTQLSIWVKGSVGGERFRVQIRDYPLFNQAWSSQQTATNAWTRFTFYLPSSFTAHPSGGTMPLFNDIYDLGIILDSTQMGSHTIWVDDLTLCPPQNYTPTMTYTRTSTSTYTGTPTGTCTTTGTITQTATQTPTRTSTMTGTATSTPTQTFTPGPSQTATSTLTSSLTGTVTTTTTFTLTATQTLTPSLTLTSSLTFTQSYTGTATQTATQTMTFSQTRTFTQTFTQSYTGTATQTASQTRTFTQTFTQSYTGTATQTASQTMTSTQTLTSSQTFTITNTPSYTNTATQTATFTQTFTFTCTLTPSYSFTPSNTVTPSCTLTSSMTFTNTATFTPTASGPLWIMKHVPYPNPVRDGNGLKVYIKMTDVPDQLIFKIYTTSIRLVQSLSIYDPANSPLLQIEYENGVALYTYTLPYDLLDMHHDRLANGMYYYAIQARRNTREARVIGKFAVLR